MLKSEPAEKRELREQRLSSDLVVVGGGVAGVCCAITAARAGLKVTLVQDRPVLGGNASSEVRLWILGATSHMGNNNRWAREGGIIDEILVENLYRNPEGNPLLVDTLLLEKVADESNIKLLLNTAVHDLTKATPETIASLRAFCSQNSTAYVLDAPLFCDASGDGIVGFLAGAAFRMGAEARSEFGEGHAPPQATAELLGHTIYFYSKDTGRPVKFVPPSFALSDITRVPRFRDFTAQDSGCRLWWIEWGGRLDTVHESETIKWELWKVVYGVWNYIKNSGQFPEAETMTLEWVGTIPGKRESRRFEGDYMLSQNDVIGQRRHPDAVSFGGWALDLHPAEGVYSAESACTQWHAKGLYQIPYRCLYSRNLTNLFLAGRLISASHVAFGSTRVMATGAHNAQAVGMAAALCLRHGLNPRNLAVSPRLFELQQELMRTGQFIPGMALHDPEDLARKAELAATSELRLSELPPNGQTLPLRRSWAMMLPVQPGPMPGIRLRLDAAKPTTLRAELRVSSKPENHTPDVTLAAMQLPLPHGARQAVELEFSIQIDQPRYAFVCLMANEALAVHLTDYRLTGVLAVCHKGNKAVTKSATQRPPPCSGIESFEFWTPERRPGGQNFALNLKPPLAGFGVRNLVNGFARPTFQSNAWVAASEDPTPGLALNWDEPQTIGRLELVFDTDYDHPMESVLLGHPERTAAFCVPRVEVFDASRRPQPVSAGTALHTRALVLTRETVDVPVGGGPEPSQPAATPGGNGSDIESRPLTSADVPGKGRAVAVASIKDHHQSRRTLRFDPPLTTDRLELRLQAPSPQVPAALFEVRCYRR